MARVEELEFVPLRNECVVRIENVLRTHARGCCRRLASTDLVMGLASPVRGFVRAHVL